MTPPLLRWPSSPRPARCHNSFNSVWHADGLDTNDPRVLSEADHRKLLVDYFGDLARWQLKGESLAGRLDGRTANSIGADASLQWMFGVQLKRIEDFENPAANLLGGARQVGTGLAIGASIVDENHLVHGTTPYGINVGHQGHLVLVNQNSAASGRFVTTDVPSTHEDWSSYTTLLVGIGGWLDPSTDATLAAAPLPRVVVLLVDAAGASAQVDFNGYGSARPSRPIRAMKDGTNATLMRVETVPIALSSFKGVNRHKVRRIALELDQSSNPNVFVDNIHLVKR